MAALGLSLIGCGGQARTPVGIFEPPDRPAGSSQPSPLVGTWRVVLIIAVQDDLQRWETEWRFGADRRCDFKRITESLVEGIPRTVTRTCAWADRGTTVDVSYDDSGRTDRLPYSFPSFDRRRLVLEGVEYERIE